MMNKFKKVFQERLLPFLKDPLFLNKWNFRYEEGESNNNRISVRLGSGGYNWVGHNYRGEIFMFVQDMYQGIMPFSHVRREGQQFEAHLEPQNPQLENMVATSLGSRSYRQNLTDSIEDFIRNATHSLFIYGRIAYEIVYQTDDDGNITEFEFDDIYPLSLIKFIGSYLQIIPWWVAKHSNVKVGIRKIPKEKVLYIEFPEVLGGRRGLKRILKRLGSLGREVIPNFQMEAMQKNKDIGFDINMYSRAKYLEIARLTKGLGWHQRKLPDNSIVEYYSQHRHLVFALAQAIIREHILTVINQALNGPILNLSSKIVMSGISTVEELQHEFDILAAGNVNFTEQFKRTLN